MIDKKKLLLLLYVFLLLFVSACGNQTVQTESSNDEVSEDSFSTGEKLYAETLALYEEAFSEYIPIENPEIEDIDVLCKKYPDIDLDCLRQYYSDIYYDWDGHLIPVYAFYDIDQNGMEEMLVALETLLEDGESMKLPNIYQTTLRLATIYTKNGEDVICLLSDGNGPDYTHTIYSDGTIVNEYDYGMKFELMRFDDDGLSLKTYANYEVDSSSLTDSGSSEYRNDLLKDKTSIVPDWKILNVDGVRWYNEAINSALNNEYFKGIDESELKPDNDTTRAMFVTVLSRMEGIDADQFSSASFSDVAEDTWYSIPVEWASKNKIVEGIGNNTFNPNGDVTREQMAAIMYRYTQYKGIDVTKTDTSKIKTFSDRSQISEWAMDAMTWAVGCGIINGTDTGIEPQDSSTLAEMTQIISNYEENVLG